MANGFHVLIVEDEPLVLDALKTTLETEYRVSSVRTIEEAYAILRTSRIDVALIDSVLPDGRGAEVTVRAERAGATVIEMTGYSPEYMLAWIRASVSTCLNRSAPMCCFRQSSKLFTIVSERLRLPRLLIGSVQKPSTAIRRGARGEPGNTGCDGRTA